MYLETNVYNDRVEINVFDNIEIYLTQQNFKQGINCNISDNKEMYCGR